MEGGHQLWEESGLLCGGKPGEAETEVHQGEVLGREQEGGGAR